MAAGVDFYLKIDDIKGESTDDKHKGEIDISSFTVGAKQATSAGGVTGAGAGKVTFDELTITKQVDTASSSLFLTCCNGTHYKNATITCRKAGGTQMDYLKIELETVFVTSYDADATEVDDGLAITETVVLRVNSMKFTYQAQGMDGKAAGGPVIGGWSTVTNKKL